MRRNCRQRDRREPVPQPTAARDSGHQRPPVAVMGAWASSQEMCAHTKGARFQHLLRVARPGLEPGTPRFSGTGPGRAEGTGLHALRSTRVWAGCPWFPAVSRVFRPRAGCPWPKPSGSPGRCPHNRVIELAGFSAPSLIGQSAHLPRWPTSGPRPSTAGCPSQAARRRARPPRWRAWPVRPGCAPRPWPCRGRGRPCARARPRRARPPGRRPRRSSR